MRAAGGSNRKGRGMTGGLGIVAAVLAASIWGAAPLLYVALAHVPPVELVAHRVIWGAVVVGLYCLVTGRGARLAAALTSRARLGRLAVSAVLVSINWFTFIWAVQAERLTEAGVGYYLMPLVAVMLSVVILGERLSRMQWLAIGCAALAVVMLTIGIGAAPWLPALLAVTFSLYGLVRRQGETGAIVGFTVEAMLVTPLCLAILAATHGLGWTAGAEQSPGWFGRDAQTTLLLIAAGPITGLPLILFAEASRRLLYSTASLIQYINPTAQVALAGLVLGEAFTPWHFGALVLIWIGLGLYSREVWRQERASPNAPTIAAGVSAKIR